MKEGKLVARVWIINEGTRIGGIKKSKRFCYKGGDYVKCKTYRTF